MLSRVVSAFQRWQYRKGRPGSPARSANRLGALSFAKGRGPDGAATLEVRGHKSGRIVSFPVVVADYQGQRYLVSMLGQNANWVRNLRADNHAVLVRGRREDVSMVEDLSGNRAAILRRYLELAPGARPFFTIDRRAPLNDFERIVDQYPLFRVASEADKARAGFGCDVVRGDLLPAGCAHQNRFGGLIAGLVMQHDRRTL